MFWDGRATGWTMGDPLAEQAKGPFLNPMEQAIPDAQTLCEKVEASSYADLFVEVWGSLSCADDTVVGVAYNDIAISIAAYERSQEVSSFTSKFDGFWDNAKMEGKDITQISMANWEKYKSLGLNNDQLRGLAIFNTKAQCSSCHTLDEGPAGYPLFTDFTYDNLGIPKNLENPATIADPSWADPGLGGFLMDTAEIGKFKVPTRCATSTSARPRRSSRPTGITATSSRWKRSSTSTTPGTSSCGLCARSIAEHEHGNRQLAPEQNP